jgi:AraC-like DNA-binding protein
MRNLVPQFYLVDESNIKDFILKQEGFLKFLWVRDGKLNLEIDGQRISISKRQILCCTYLQKIELKEGKASALLLTFNREFYCIHTNDEEVSCNGLLFFGSNFLPLLTLDQPEVLRLNILIQVLKEEFDTIDLNQEEMLRLLLKRFIIRCTRLARKQLIQNHVGSKQLSVIRQFSALVEEYFRNKKLVGEYAEILNKSPKTLANIFAKVYHQTPLQIIHGRIILEAKRLLIYTDKSTKQISAELGYEDPANFVKFFKNNSGITPTKCRLGFINDNGKNGQFKRKFRQDQLLNPYNLC